MNRTMRQIFYRKTPGVCPRPLILWMVVVLGVLLIPTAHAAPDPDMALPPISVPPLMQNVAMIVPYDLGRLPVPPRKPRGNNNDLSIARTAWDRGLHAYRRGDARVALAHFMAAEAEAKNSPRSNPKGDSWAHAAAAFWAARAAEQLGEHRVVDYYRQLAAQYPRTFYGQLAATQAGQALNFSWDIPASDLVSMRKLHAYPAVRAAAAHIAAGRFSAADQSLQALATARGIPADLRLAALQFALHHGLPASALKLSGSVVDETGQGYLAAAYPVGAWMDQGDFRVDRALVHAIIRQESSFNSRARSKMGAVGLMQLLPSTARYVTKIKAGGGKVPQIDLTHSVHNLSTGQDYLEYLLDREAVGGDIMNMLVAYNAGPGNLAKWQRDLDDVTDPLLFIELIPAAETRAYVEKVMAAYWIYRDRFGMGNPTLALIAAGERAPLASPPNWFAGLKFNLAAYTGM